MVFFFEDFYFSGYGSCGIAGCVTPFSVPDVGQLKRCKETIFLSNQKQLYIIIKLSVSAEL